MAPDLSSVFNKKKKSKKNLGLKLDSPALATSPVAALTYLFILFYSVPRDLCSFCVANPIQRKKPRIVAVNGLFLINHSLRLPTIWVEVSSMISGMALSLLFDESIVVITTLN